MSRARVAAAMLLSLFACACNDQHGAGPGGTTLPPAADEYFYDCEAPTKPPSLAVYATDEAFKEFVNKDAAAPPMKNDALAPHLTDPVPPATLSATTPPTFTFAPMQSAAAPARPPARMAARAPAPFRLGRFLSSLLEGTAHAHCAAVSGDNFLVRLIDKDTIIYTALVSVVSFTPGEAAWKKALDGRLEHGVTVTIERATFSTGSITLGPYVAASSPTFTVGP
jgi:hypothetical protein